MYNLSTKKNINQYVDFFEQPTITKLLYIFILHGGIVLIILSIISIILITNIEKNFIIIENYMKPMKKINNINNLNLKKNITNVLWCIIRKQDINELKNFNQLDLLIQFIMIVCLLIVVHFSMFLLIEIISKLYQIQFRYDIFSNFLKNVSINHFFNPNECLSFISNILENTSNYVNNIFGFSASVYVFFSLYKMCFSSNFKWNIILIIWFVLQILLFVFMSMFKGKHDSSISTLESNYIFNYESEKIFKMFSNSEEEYYNMIKQNTKKNIMNDIKIRSAIIIGNIISFFIFGYGMINYIYLTSEFIILLPTLLSMLFWFNSIPYKIEKLYGSIKTIKSNLYPFNCYKNKHIIILNKNDILDKINKK